MSRMSLAAPAVLLAVLAGCLGGGARNPPAPAKSGLETLDFRRVVQSAKDKVFPAVVFIKCLRESHEGGEKTTQQVAGSGVIIAPTGEVLTNWHVIDKATEIRCLLFDGRPMAAKLVGKDKDTDLALLQLEMPAGAAALPCAALGDSAALKEGDFVMAMGAPWGLSRSVSIGIVSCTRRFLPEHGEYSLWLQTDASICPGNSGGPLINTDGQIVGINTLGTFFGGDMGFAIPAETIGSIVPQLREHGKANWSWTGLQLQALKDFERNIYFEAAEGVVVAGTDPESPARRAGIQPRDRLLRINAKAVSAVTDEDLPAVRRELGLLPRTAPARIELMRGEALVAVELTPREKGKVEGEELDCPRWDFTAKAINQFDNPDLYFQKKAGVFVFGIKYPGNAEAAGLRAQDILLSIDGKEVSTLEELKAIHKAAVAGVEARSKLVLTVKRNGVLKQIVLDFSRDYEKE